MATRTALLIVDMQKVFEPMTITALPNIHGLLKHFQQSKQPIIFTQHGHTKEELTTNPSPNQLVRKWGPNGSIAIGSKDWEIQDSLATQTQPIKGQAWPKLLKGKNTYDSFINTDLERILKEEAKAERVVVCGVMTDCCCDTTARAAFNRGFETWLVSDACGSANKKQHEAGLRGFEFAFGWVPDTSEALERLKEEGL